MKSQLLKQCGLVALAAVGVAADASCIDCETPVVANSDWANGVLATGDYYHPSKVGNWMLGNTTTGEGQLELRSDPDVGNYVYNLCPAGGSYFCAVYLAQLITVQAGVTYELSIEYSMNGVRNNRNILQMFVETYPGRETLFSQWTYSGNTAWTTFSGTDTWTSTVSADVIMTLTWDNDPNDATVLIKSASLSPVECRNPESTKTCSAVPDPTTTTTTDAATSTTTDDAATTTTDAAATTATLNCSRRKRRRHLHI